MRSRRTRLIVNPAAGAGRARARLLAARSALDAFPGGTDWIETSSAAQVTAAARDAALAGDASVLVAGGDGTVHFAAAALVGSDTALGILPVGTGNDVAESLGLPRDLAAALACLAAGDVRRIDVGRAGGRIFACVLGVGMDTAALERIDRARFLRHGRLLYTYAALRTLLTYRPRRATIECGGARFEGPLVFAAVTNTQTYAGGIRVSPRASVADGRLDLCAIPKMPIARLLARFRRVVAGRHEGLPGVVMAQGARVRIESEEALPVTLDGERTDLRTPLDVTVLPGALRVIGAPLAPSPRTLVEEAAHARA